MDEICDLYVVILMFLHYLTLLNWHAGEKEFDEMPESRDRLSRQDNIVASYSQRRISRTGGSNNNGRGNSIAFVLEDDSEQEQASRTPFRWRDTTMVGELGLITPSIRPPVVGNGRSRGGAFRTPRVGHIASLRGPENFSPLVGNGRGHSSHGRRVGGVLPTWYPRRPLNDITAVVRVTLCFLRISFLLCLFIDIFAISVLL